MLRGFSGGWRKLLFKESGSCAEFADDDLARFLGLSEPDTESWNGGKSSHASASKYKQAIFGNLRSRLAVLEADSASCRLSENVASNIGLVASLVGLNRTETSILEFFVCVERVEVVLTMLRLIVYGQRDNLPSLISRILKLPHTRVAKALSMDSRLFSNGILVWQNDHHRGSHERPRLFSRSLARAVFNGTLDERTILVDLLTPAPVSALSLEDYPHLSREIELAVTYLKRCLKKRKKGVNIYLYGPPGTGKSELARLLCETIGVSGYEAATAGERGDPCESRSAAFRAGTAFLEPGNSLVIFDEAEDVFSSPSPFSGSAARTNKGWFNRMLETNRIPVIWVSNDISDLDPAFTRRFDFVFKVPVPPRHQREKTIAKILGKNFGESFVRQLAHSEKLSPAVVARARSVVGGLRGSQMESAVSLLVSNTLTAQGHPDPFHGRSDTLDPTVYDMSFLNTTADLGGIVEGLRRNPSGRICLYGPPGTGKTSFAHCLAEKLSLPLHLRKASDLLSPYHGESEKLMARAFGQAVEEKAILLIDEVDSFLRDRSLAQRSWEVSQTNEFLTQMEGYQGIFIASTNLRENLDPACLRRFDLKLCFHELLPEQAARLFAAHCAKLGLPAPSPAESDAVSRLEKLTPGDFATVARQSRFRPIASAGDFVDLLSAEVAMKSGSPGRTIGFTP